MIEPRVHPSGERVLELEGVGITLGGSEIVRDITFHVLRGEFLCLLGPNGAGKSTLLKAMLGLIAPTAGRILVLDKPPGTPGVKVAYVPQLKSFNREFPATALELIIANLRGRWPIRVRQEERERAMHALERARGTALAHRRLDELSGGETQRVFLARALVVDPELILLDEPEAGVDARGRDDLYDLLGTIAADDFLSAVMVTHSQVAINMTAEKIAFIDGTVQAFGLPSELFGHGRLSQLMVHHGEG